MRLTFVNSLPTASLPDAAADASQPYCCYLDADPPIGLPCPEPAEWEIVAVGGDPYDYTHACSAHVGLLLGDAPEYRVRHLGAHTEDKKP